ncbi:histone deacetylase HDA1 [Spathaspora passalidarum NRRL Y-27907]|uniref:Histone deacetylase HDA1 n=1 Tax=Spathaspora passalidarum (strain NRRL Y-27907 / 11-Y1) TaxID=619300 RepID=G3AIF9_SPAPN|nr:histone deacetylase HDA1 [Spathaspora passalidarum NRRL Y-27907]EGW34429.1 histone deacetylase HDA1 [Spathaspora passalidarum NRRL Y-27907]
MSEPDSLKDDVVPQANEKKVDGDLNVGSGETTSAAEVSTESQQEQDKVAGKASDKQLIEPEEKSKEKEKEKQTTESLHDGAIPENEDVEEKQVDDIVEVVKQEDEETNLEKQDKIKQEEPEPMEIDEVEAKDENLESVSSEIAKDETTSGEPKKHEVSNGEEVEPPHKKIKLEEQSNGINENKIVVVPPTKPHLFYTPLKTGLVYDVRMRYHAKIFTSYFEYIDPHPEDPRRIYRIYKKLAEAGLIQDSSLSGVNDIGPLMLKIPIREATAEEILEVHSESHLKFIESTETMTRDQLMEETEKGDSIYVNNDSYFSARLSCGGTIEACKAVIEGRVKNSLAVVRPPGHHAEPDSPGGFCLFSNVAVAAKNLLKTYPESVRKIVIIDWDIHHGNGTQKSFYNDPRVLYISMHRYENGRFYPGTKYGNSDQVGEEEGEGFNINIPWRSSGMHDGDYVYAFNKVILPTIIEFDPDLIIVSSGFDAADGDIIGGCHVTPAGYGYMTHMLKGIAKGKLAVILEGGYNLDSISKSALAVAKVLVGEPPENTISMQPHLDAVEVVDEVIKIQAKYWKCLRHGIPSTSFDDVFDLPDDTNYKLVNISDTIRSHQNNELFNKYSFINIPIIGTSGSPSDDKGAFTVDLPAQLEDIIIASPDIHNCTTIILSIHDPPDIWANIHPVSGTIEAGSSVILEHPLTKIIDRVAKEESASSERIGYIDINIPSFPLPIPSFTKSPSSSYNPTIFAQELLLYIWDNYLAYFSVKKLVFVGFGDAYQAIVHLFGKRPSSDIKELVKGTIAFVNRTTLKPLVPVMDESMVDWYYQNSVVFTSCLNPCWSGVNGNGKDMDETKRPRRKFGRVLKASGDGLYDVIQERFDEGVDFILDSIEDYSSEESNN